MKVRLSQHWLLIADFFMILAAHNVSAADYSSEQDYLQEFPVVLSASRLSQPLSEAPNAMTVIDRAAIKESGFRTISDLFRLVPGMYVGYVDGHTPIVAYHGSTDNFSRRMQVLIDGRSVYLPPTSSVSWEDIPLQIDDIERIEVVRGPAAASHGANSLQGVVNIITRGASSVHGTDISTATGSGGVADVALHVGKVGTDLDYRATLAYRADDGLPGKILNDGHITYLANVRADYHPNASDSFDFQLGYNQGTRGRGTAGQTTDLYRDARAISSFQQLTWLHTLSQQDEFKLNYYHIYRTYTDDQPAGVPITGTTTESHLVNRHEIELQHTLQLGATDRLVWGGGMRTDAVDNPLNLTTPQFLRQSRLFAHDEWRALESAILNVGAMYENDGMGHKNISPRIALNYHLTSRHTMRVGNSVAYRSPATLEEKSNRGNLFALGGVKPERINSKEIGYLGEFNTIGVSVDARVYYDRVSDIIYYDPSPIGPPNFNGVPYSFSNIFSAAYRGFESAIKYRWAEKSDLTFNYSRQTASCTMTGTLREPLYLPTIQGVAAACSSMVPRNSGSILLARQMSNDVRFSAGYYHQSKLKFFDTTVPVSIMRRLDLRVAKAFGRQDEGEVALVVQNVFKDNYTEYGVTSATWGKLFYGRNAYLTAALNF